WPDLFALRPEARPSLHEACRGQAGAKSQGPFQQAVNRPGLHLLVKATVLDGRSHYDSAVATRHRVREVGGKGQLGSGKAPAAPVEKEHLALDGSNSHWG